MIELREDRLVFSFPKVHADAELAITFQRTLRIPDDGRDYPLPPGLGRFPLRLVDDFAASVRPKWLEHGGVMMPMYQSEALWLDFGAASLYGSEYPFAVKVATGKIDAITGEGWDPSLHRNPQDYLVTPEQTWLDGFCVEEGVIRQFVAMPLGSGHSVEEQLTGEAAVGGLQLIVYPMKREVYERRFAESWRQTPPCLSAEPMSADMGLGAGGRMRQEIYEDPFDFDDWDREHSSSCFVHLANSLVWRSITGEDPPTVPFTSREYERAGLPWFEYYDESAKALKGSDKLAGVTSIAQLAEKKGDVALPENESVTADNIVHIRKGLKANQVREGKW